MSKRPHLLTVYDDCHYSTSELLHGLKQRVYDLEINQIYRENEYNLSSNGGDMTLKIQGMIDKQKEKDAQEA